MINYFSCGAVPVQLYRDGRELERELCYEACAAPY